MFSKRCFETTEFPVAVLYLTTYIEFQINHIARATSAVRLNNGKPARLFKEEKESPLLHN